ERGNRVREAVLLEEGHAQVVGPIGGLAVGSGGGRDGPRDPGQESEAHSDHGGASDQGTSDAGMASSRLGLLYFLEARRSKSRRRTRFDENGEIRGPTAGRRAWPSRHPPAPRSSPTPTRPRS